MFKHSLLAASTALLLATGCGSSDRGSDPDPTDSSSAPTSSGAASSGANSSAAISSSSSFDLNGRQPAAWSDLHSMIDFGTQGGMNIRYVFGESGIYSKIFLGTGNNVLAHAAGTYTLNQGHMTLEHFDCLAPSTMADTLCPRTGPTPYLDDHLYWTVSGDSLWGGSDSENLPLRQAGTLETNELQISNPSSLIGSWRFTRADTVRELEIQSDWSYVSRTQVGSTVTTTEYGLWDVHGNSILLATDYCVGLCIYVDFFTGVLNAGNLVLTRQGTNDPRTFVAGTLPPLPDPTALAAEWRGITTDNYLWNLDLNANGNAVLRVLSTSPNPEYFDTGKWKTVGSWLVLDFSDGNICTGQGNVGLNNGANCWSLVQGPVLVGDTLNFSNSQLPTHWTRRAAQ